jgi:hypothetical protein
MIVSRTFDYRTLARLAAPVGLTMLLAACGGGGGGGGGGDSQPTPPASSTPAPYVPPAPPPPPPVATPVMLSMSFEHTQNVQNLYSSSECRLFTGALTPCTIPTDTLNRTRIWIATNSSAIADGALTASEIEDAGIRLHIYWDGTKTLQWYPGEVELQFYEPTSGLIAYKSGTEWRLFEGARIKRAKYQFHCLEAEKRYCEYAEVMQSYSGIIQVEMTQTGSYPACCYKRQMFVTGPFLAK